MFAFALEAWVFIRRRASTLQQDIQEQRVLGRSWKFKPRFCESVSTCIDSYRPVYLKWRESIALLFDCLCMFTSVLAKNKGCGNA